MRRLLSTAVLAGALFSASGACAVASPAGHPRSGLRTRSAARTADRREGGARRDAIRLALRDAGSYWGATPCGGRIVVSAGLGVPEGMSPTTDAWVTFASALGANDLEAPAHSYTDCRIGLARWQWPTAAAISSDWGMFCLTVIHEVGHLLGHPHSPLAGSVMAPVFTDESSVPRICRRRVPGSGEAGSA